MLGIKEVVNFFYIGKAIKKLKQKQEWSDLKLRVDWVNRIYTVINLRKENLGDPEQVKEFLVKKQATEISKFLNTEDLDGEIMYPIIKKETERSYPIIFVPAFNYFSIYYIIKFLLVLSLLIYLPIHFLL